MGEQEDGSGVQTAAALRLHVAEELKIKGGGHRQGASQGAGGERGCQGAPTLGCTLIHRIRRLGLVISFHFPFFLTFVLGQ
eukprot:3009770-Amphidinium_carterae.1